MSHRLGNFVLAVLLVGLATPLGTVLAGHDDDSRDRHGYGRTEAYWERYAAREARNYQEEQEEAYARLERERTRVESRLKKSRERLCDRLERLERRLGIDLTLPAFCDPVAPPPPPPPVLPLPTVDLVATPLSVTTGSTSTLTWNTTNATYCLATGGWTGTKATTGTSEVTVNATTTYTLACGNATGTTTDSVEVVVTPVPVVLPPLPTVDLNAVPLSVTASGTSTLSWSTTNAAYCLATGGWTGARAVSGATEVTVTATTTYTLACGNATGTTTDSVEVVVTPVPVVVPVLGKVVLSEVIYDLATTGQGSESANEWIELYNGTNAPVDIAGWKIKDGNSTSTIATSTPYIVPAGGYAVVVASTTTAGFWTIGPAVTVAQITGKEFGNGLTNGSDVVQLYNSSNVLIDAMGWGGNLVAFDSTGLTAPAGSSLARVPVTTDTDTKNDWVVLAVPTPGL